MWVLSLRTSDRGVVHAHADRRETLEPLIERFARVFPAADWDVRELPGTWNCNGLPDFRCLEP